MQKDNIAAGNAFFFNLIEHASKRFSGVNGIKDDTFESGDFFDGGKVVRRGNPVTSSNIAVEQPVWLLSNLLRIFARIATLPGSTTHLRFNGMSVLMVPLERSGQVATR